MYKTIKKFIKFPKNINQKQIIAFFNKKGLKGITDLANKKSLNVNEIISKNPYKPELVDLYRLYQFVVLNKRTTIMEFGSGFSSLIFSLALKENKKKYRNIVKKLRRNNSFELFVIENEKKFLNITKKRIMRYQKNKEQKKDKNNNIKVNFLFSDCYMTIYNGNYATEYKKVPLCNPDFIYLDGPDQFKIKNRVNNFTTAHKDMMPMICDILKFENFLTPGTIIVCDGRTANSEFMLNNFKRKWIHYYDRKFDQHIFYLNSDSLGKYNDLQLKFYKHIK